LLGRPTDPTLSRDDTSLSEGIPRREDLLKFLSHRQFIYLAQDEHDDEDDEENFIQRQLDALNLDQSPQYVGMNGRWNKKADTCYYWWAAGALSVSFFQDRCTLPAQLFIHLCLFLRRFLHFSCWTSRLLSAYSQRVDICSTSHNTPLVAFPRESADHLTFTTHILVSLLWRSWENKS
jgi:hypothetical protein